MATVVQVYSVSESDTIRNYIDSLTINNGLCIAQINDEVYIITW